MGKELKEHQQIERSIITTYRKELWSPFTRAVKRYELIRANDKIAVCISGGKDSMLLAKLMQELHRHSDIPFDLEFLVMDPGYNPENREKILANALLLHVPVTIFETKIFNIANHTGDSPCYLCARMRRGALYSKAKELGCNKIALGHHMNDVIETTVMTMFYSSQIRGMLPKLHSMNFEGMELIRPMYFIRERDILRWKEHNHLSFLQCACRFTEEYERAQQGDGVSKKEASSKRYEVKKLIETLRQTNPDIEDSIMNSIHSVRLDTMPGYKANGEDHSFLDHYEEADHGI